MRVFTVLKLLSRISVKGAMSWFVHFEKFSLLNCSSLSFAIHVNHPHPLSSLFPFGLFLALCSLSTLANHIYYYLKVFFQLMTIFSDPETTQNIVMYSSSFKSCSGCQTFHEPNLILNFDRQN